LIRNAIRYLIGLTIVVGAYFLYAAVAVPLLEGSVKRAAVTQQADNTESIPRRTARHRLWLKDLLPETAWEHESSKVLETKQGTVIFKDYKTLPDGQIHVEPFTLIIQPGPKKPVTVSGTVAASSEPVSTEQPILLRTAQGAILNFEKDPNDKASFNFGKLIGGHLPGSIEVWRPKSAHDADDELVLVTSNIQIDPKKIYTPNDVEFRFGPHKGYGRNLLIEMESPGGASLSAGSGESNFKSLELSQLTELKLSTAKSSRRAQRSGSTAPSQAASAKESDPPLFVTCSGAFRLDFQQHIAAFERDVVARQTRPASGIAKIVVDDRLSCERLEVHFTDDTSDSLASPRSSEASRSDARDKKLNVRRVIALGAPATLDLQSREAHIEAGSLEYNLVKQSVVLKDDRTILLRDQEHEIRASQLEYRFDSQGRLGTGWASGPGEFIRQPISSDGKIQPKFHASWSTELNLQPHDGKKAISLFGAAKILFDDRSFSSDELHLWLWETPQPVAETVALDPNATLELIQPQSAGDSTKTKSNTKKKWKISPAQVLAKGQVLIESPTVIARTGELQAFWPKPTDSPPPTPEFALDKKADGSHVSSPVPKKDESQSTATKASNRDPLNVTSLKATLNFDAQQRFTRLQLDGAVTLFETASESNPKPLKIQGKQLSITPTGSPDLFDMALIGDPVLMTGRGMEMKGSEIHLSQLTNEILIPGAGEVTLLLADESIDAQQPRLRDSLEPGTTTVRWTDKLVFDGKQAVAQGDVFISTIRRSETATHHIVATSEQLMLWLTEQITFGQPSKRNTTNPKSKPELERVAILGNAQINHESIATDGQRESIERMASAEISLNHRTGEIESPAAGVLESSRLGVIDLNADPTADSQSRNRRERNSRQKQQLTFMQIRYGQRLDGNLFERAMAFHGNVRAVYGPVQSWEERLDVDTGNRRPSDVTLSCDQLAVGTWQQQSAKDTVEMTASGNATVQGENFETQSHIVSFEQATDLLKLEGNSRNNAQIRFRKSPNEAWQNAAANKIRFWRSTGKFEIDQLGQLEFSTQGRPSPRQQ
jgi:hypothetical protein